MNVIKKGKDLFWSCLEKLIKMWRCSSMLERSYECNKNGQRFILELFGEPCVM